MKKYYEAPNKIPNNERGGLFLAGSITGAWNWQEKAAEKLIAKYHIYNPRRSDYGICSEEKLFEQIKWEYDALRQASHVLFYFSHETVAPITLFELGSRLEDSKSMQEIFICCHPNYPRARDVRIQATLNGYNHRKIYRDLDEMVGDVLKEKY